MLGMHLPPCQAHGPSAAGQLCAWGSLVCSWAPRGRASRLPSRMLLLQSHLLQTRRLCLQERLTCQRPQRCTTAARAALQKDLQVCSAQICDLQGGHAANKCTCGMGCNMYQPPHTCTREKCSQCSHCLLLCAWLGASWLLLKGSLLPPAAVRATQRRACCLQTQRPACPVRP